MTVMDKDYIRLWGVMGSGEGEGISTCRASCHKGCGAEP